jgi:hypothetical protein
MEIEATSTDRIVTLNGVPARIWEGRTKRGKIACYLFVTRIAVRDTADTREFEAELEEHEPPSKEAASFPSRMVL